MLAPTTSEFLENEEYVRQERIWLERYNRAIEDYRKAIAELAYLNIPFGATVEVARAQLVIYFSVLRKLLRLYQLLDAFRTFVINNHPDGELRDAQFRKEINVVINDYTKVRERIKGELSNISFREPERAAFTQTILDGLLKFDKLFPPSVPVRIYPRQMPHYERLRAIASRYHVHIDQSKPGAGKTYVNMMLVPNEAAVYCPAILCDKWRAVGLEVGRTITEALSYEALTGNRQNQSRSLFLRRDIRANTISTTPEYDEFLRRGGWLIFDEYQRLRNGNTFTTACLTLICRLAQARREGWSTSRIALLSGTPGDKDANAYSIILLLGLTEYPSLYSHDFKTKSTAYTKGWDDVRRWMMTANPERAAAIYESMGKPTQTLVQALIKIVIPTLASRMPVRDMGIYRNGYFHIVPEDRPALEAALTALSRAIRPAEDDPGRRGKKNSFGQITTALTQVESAVVGSMIRDTLILLNQISSCKVILVVWYVPSRNRIIEAVRRFGVERLGLSPERAHNLVLELGSNITAKKRQEYITAFNAYTTDVRVIVMHPEVGGAGIDLDDKVGPSAEFPVGMPRYTLVSPNYNLLTLSQSMSRASRVNTQSVPFVFLYYAQGTPQRQIMDNLYQKSLKAHLMSGGDESELAEALEEGLTEATSAEEDREVLMSYDVTYPSQFHNYLQPNIYRTQTDPLGYVMQRLVLPANGEVFPYFDAAGEFHRVGDAGMGPLS